MIKMKTGFCRLAILSLFVFIFLTTDAGAADWSMEVVSTGGEHSLDLDSEGNPHIAFEIQSGGDSAPTTVSYASRSAGGWSVEEIGTHDKGGSGLVLKIDSQDIPQCAYSTEWGNAINYGKKVGGVWETSKVRGQWTYNGGITPGYEQTGTVDITPKRFRNLYLEKHIRLTLNDTDGGFIKAVRKDFTIS